VDPRSVPNHTDRLTAALADRYAIKRELGSGGMATVYLADDLRHRRQVAVKVLRPDLAATLGPERFFREIEIAAQLQNPHILPLLDSGEAKVPGEPDSNPYLFYVMPYIEGESLRERLTRMRELPVPEAIRLLRDVADALSHAHAQGVVHRDIKPENVMLTGRHALVMDFGVAKAVSEAKGGSTLTTAGVALGTPAYMAPEQAAADPHVDYRADIYALGAMGYELIAGRPPFVAVTPQQLLAMHVTQEPDPVSRYRPGVPPGLEQLLMRCLAKRAADRWQGADEIVERLEALGPTSGGTTPTQTQPTTAVPMPTAWYGHPLRTAGLFLLVAVAVLGVVYFITIQFGLPDWVPWGALGLLAVGLPIMVLTGLVERQRAQLKATGVWTASGETGLHRHVTWKKATRGGVYAFGGLAALAIAYTTMRLLGIGPVGTLVASGKLQAKDKLVVAEFTNRTSDSTLGGSVSEAFRIDLAQSPVVSMLSPAEISAALTRMNRNPGAPLDLATARELATREGAKAVVVGEISPVGKGYALSARVLSAADGSELVVQRESAEDDSQILKAIDKLSKSVRERIGESLRTIRASDPLDQVTTSSLEALRLYTEGTRAVSAADNERGIQLLRQAVAIDTGFAMAWRKLSVAIANSGGSLKESLDAANRAYRHRDRLPELERYHAEAFYYWQVAVDRERAIGAYRAVLGLNPVDPTALINLASILDDRRQWAEAESLGVRAIAVAPASVPAYFVTLQAQLALGKVNEARATVDRLAASEPNSPGAGMVKAGYFVATGAFDSLRTTLERYLTRTRDPSIKAGILRDFASLELMEGKLQAASQRMQEAAAVAEERHLPGQYLGTTAYLAAGRAAFLGDTAGAVKLIESALKRHPLQEISAPDRPTPFLAVVYALAGRPAEARRYLAIYEADVPADIRNNLPGGPTAEGYIALAEGRAGDAVAAFRLARDRVGCSNCYFFELGQAFDLQGNRDSALANYTAAVERPHDNWSLDDRAWAGARAFRRLGQLYEASGQKDKALDYYGRFTSRWAHADAELQPQVREVKERMAKLAGEQ
jgi:tetratricopeptide (TPR) repeat protein